MRKVSTRNFSKSDPASIFEAGINQIIIDRSRLGSSYDDQELRAMQRSPVKQSSGMNLQTTLSHLFWPNFGNRS